MHGNKSFNTVCASMKQHVKDARKKIKSTQGKDIQWKQKNLQKDGSLNSRERKTLTGAQFFLSLSLSSVSHCWTEPIGLTSRGAELEDEQGLQQIASKLCWVKKAVGFNRCFEVSCLGLPTHPCYCVVFFFKERSLVWLCYAGWKKESPLLLGHSLCSRCMVSLGTVHQVNDHPHASPTVLGVVSPYWRLLLSHDLVKLQAGLLMVAVDTLEIDSQTHRNVHLCTL